VLRMERWLWRRIRVSCNPTTSLPEVSMCRHGSSECTGFDLGNVRWWARRGGGANASMTRPAYDGVTGDTAGVPRRVELACPIAPTNHGSR
jgi:hypothetical protein